MEEECVPKMNVGLGTKILNMGKYLVYCVIDFDCLQNRLHENKISWAVMNLVEKHAVVISYLESSTNINLII